MALSPPPPSVYSDVPPLVLLLGRQAKRFEAMAASFHPEDARECPEFLRHKRYLFSPGVLRDHGIEADTVGEAGREREREREREGKR